MTVGIIIWIILGIEFLRLGFHAKSVYFIIYDIDSSEKVKVFLSCPFSKEIGWLLLSPEA